MTDWRRNRTNFRLKKNKNNKNKVQLYRHECSFYSAWMSRFLKHTQLKPQRCNTANQLNNIWTRTQTHIHLRIIKLFIYHTTKKMYTLQRWVMCSGNTEKRSSLLCNCTSTSNRKRLIRRRKGSPSESEPLLPSVQWAPPPGTQSLTLCQVTKCTIILQLFSASSK